MQCQDYPSGRSGVRWPRGSVRTDSVRFGDIDATVEFGEMSSSTYQTPRRRVVTSALKASRTFVLCPLQRSTGYPARLRRDFLDNWRRAGLLKGWGWQSWFCSISV